MREPKNSRRRKAPKNTEWRGDTLYGRKRFNGQLKRWSLRTGDPSVAADRVAQDITRLEAATFYGEDRVKYRDTAGAWVQQIASQISPSTARRYLSSLKMLEPMLGNLFLDEIDKGQVKAYVEVRLGAGAKPATVRRDLTVLSNIFEFAEVDPNPALARLRRLKERRDPIVLPDPANIEHMIARCPGRMADLVAVAWHTGCRLEELVTAERARLDHGRRQLTVKGKGNKVRVIDLDFGGAYEILRKLPVRLGCRWLFWHGQGEPYRNLSSRFASLVAGEFRAAEKAAIAAGHEETDFRKFRFHDLRHRHAVDWLKAGGSIYDLQQRLGHASIKTTEIYLKFLTAEEARTVKFGSQMADTAEQRGT